MGAVYHQKVVSLIKKKQENAVLPSPHSSPFPFPPITGFIYWVQSNLQLLKKASYYLSAGQEYTNFDQTPETESWSS